MLLRMFSTGFSIEPVNTEAEIPGDVYIMGGVFIETHVGAATLKSDLKKRNEKSGL